MCARFNPFESICVTESSLPINETELQTLVEAFESWNWSSTSKRGRISRDQDKELGEQEGELGVASSVDSIALDQGLPLSDEKAPGADGFTGAFLCTVGGFTGTLCRLTKLSSLSGSVVSVHVNAAWELIRSFALHWTRVPDFKEGGCLRFFRLVGLFFPGLSAHGPQDYDNSARLTIDASFPWQSRHKSSALVNCKTTWKLF